MLRVRLVLAAALAAATALTGAPAGAAGDEAGGIGDLAAEAAGLVAEEQVLLRLNASNSTMAPEDRADLRALLHTVDGRGVVVLARFDELEVELTAAVRSALGPLPPPSATDGPTDAAGPPPSVVYETAIADLGRLADTAGSTAWSPEGERPTGLLLVGLGAFVAVAAALAAALARWRPGDRDLEALAWTDALTGVANRRRLDDDLTAHAGVLVTVAMVDVDHFKTVNDRFGHQTGDVVLRRVAAALTQQVRLDDLVYRYGGEEFCVLFRHTGVDDAAPLVDEIVAAARQIVLPDGDHITVSVGIADNDGRDLLEAVEAADRALYAAKDQGRDRVVTVLPADRLLTSA